MVALSHSVFLKVKIKFESLFKTVVQESLKLTKANSSNFFAQVGDNAGTQGTGLGLALAKELAEGYVRYGWCNK